ncbi:unnamed protein product [Arabis nemorensis]|uniref:NYN domain-containing protein n=1 Tax=Arabis nemorensis TaxID=586526 RepID=A0A565BB41_9BRAS|nr:unnamed protein product [Arabis nemorensis]
MELFGTYVPFPDLEDQKPWTYRTSPEPSGEFCNANTGVFWDVRDYRIPDLFNPDLVKQKIIKAVLDAGYTGDVSILLWIPKNKDSDHLLQLYSAANIPITFVPKDDELEMIHNIVVGILLWSLDNPEPANVMVVSEHISYDMLESLDILRGDKNYRVLISNPLEDCYTDIFPCGSLDWLVKSLSPPNKKKRPIADISDSEGSDNSTYLVGVNPSPMRYSAETSETMWSEFPPPPPGCDGKIYLLVEVICRLDFI